ncbi:MAG: rod shape-determining protein MreD [Candidatus Nitronauta litoralis]|uniref:Rod shape-determining protein MreD n=1 Tax=Candidatus Nitronauta litoralis TaxID=2705533 RepID=A0A7T0BTG9_9BACT|nr:MAG: rod shape-determining protein MreD [Candidatus Nitronauta litoralis]
MPGLILFAYGILLFSIQTSLMDKFAISGVTPDFALIATVFCAVTFSPGRGFAAGCVLGFVQDCLSGGLLGVNTLSKSLIAHTFCQLKGKIMVEGPVPVFVFLLVASVFDSLIFFGSTLLLFRNPPSLETFLGNMPVYVLYNAIVGPFLILFFNRSFQWWNQKLQTS